MKCIICGATISDNETFCSECNRPKEHFRDKQQYHYSPISENSGYPLTRFSRKFFYGLFELYLWFTLIGVVIFCTQLLGVLGFFIGIFGGLVSVGILGGIVAIFLRMAEDIEKIKKSNKEYK